MLRNNHLPHNRDRHVRLRSNRRPRGAPLFRQSRHPNHSHHDSHQILKNSLFPRKSPGLAALRGEGPFHAGPYTL